MIEMKSLNGFEIVDAKAREDIETLKSKEVDVDLSDYYTKTETDTLLESVDADIVISDDGEGNVTIDAAPGSGEGGSSNVDLSNYYTKDETYSKTEVDALIPTGGGSSEGGAKVVILNNFSNSVTDEDRANVKELCEYFYSNNYTFPNTAYYIKYNSNEIYIVERIYISTSWNGGYEINFYFTTDNGKYSNYCQLDSDYNWSSGYVSYQGSSSSAKDWQWVSVENNNCYIGSYKHIKLVVREDGYDERYTFDISEPDTICSVSKTYILPSYSDNITLYNNYGECSISGDRSYTIVGYYYWG